MTIHTIINSDYASLAQLFQQNAEQRRLLRRYLAECRWRYDFDECIRLLPILERLYNEARFITALASID